MLTLFIKWKLKLIFANYNEFLHTIINICKQQLINNFFYFDQIFFKYIWYNI